MVDFDLDKAAPLYRYFIAIREGERAWAAYERTRAIISQENDAVRDYLRKNGPTEIRFNNDHNLYVAKLSPLGSPVLIIKKADDETPQ